MPRSMKRLTAITLSAALLAGLASSTALAQSGGTAPTGTTTAPTDPCRSHSPALRCPDFVMRAPYDRYFQRVGSRILYRAGNTLLNIGPGPNELLGLRTGPGRMRVIQHIYGVDRRRYNFASRGQIVFKFVPGYGSFWKFENAAWFELWTVDFRGNLIRKVRTGPKIIYCLRDLFKRSFSLASPRFRVYPACSQDPRRTYVTIGNSVGWSDDYPSAYPEQYIDVTGLSGRFIFRMVADPLNHVREANEGNNASPGIFLRLPPGTPPRASNY